MHELILLTTILWTGITMQPGQNIMIPDGDRILCLYNEGKEDDRVMVTEDKVTMGVNIRPCKPLARM